MRRGRLRFVVLALSVSGCGQEPTQPAGPAEWSVDGAPLVSIGETDGPEEYLFQSVRNARFLPDGRLVVADAGLSTVRVFDSSGVHEATMRGQGEGPGEFGTLGGMWIVEPDTVGIFDSGLYRFAFFGPDGVHVRTVGLDRAGAGSGVGSLALLAGPYGADGVLLASVAPAPGLMGPDVMSAEAFGHDGSHRGRVLETTGLVRAQYDNFTGPIPFSPFPWWATDGDALYRLDGWDPRVHRGAGETAVSHSLAVGRRDGDEAWAELRAALEEGGRPPYVDLAPTLEALDSVPSLAGLLVDGEGRVWTRAYDPSRDPLWLGNAPRVFGGTWWVMNRDGTVLATAAIPEDLAPLQISDGRVLGVSVDELGVERIRVHRLNR